MPVTESQMDFSGGMVDQVPPDRIPANAYSFAENVEHRDILRARRGDADLMDASVFATGGALAGRVLGGVGKYVDATGTESFVMLTYTLNEYGDVEDPVTYRWQPPDRDTLDVLLLPGAVGGVPLPEGYSLEGLSVLSLSLRVRYCQYYGHLFMLHGWDSTDHDVWVWDGNAAGWAISNWPGKCGYAIGAYGRVWAVLKDDDGFIDTVVASDITFEGALTWPTAAVYSFRVGPGTKDNIVALVEIGGGRIVVLKEHSAYVIHNCLTNPEDIAYEIEMIDERHGCVGYSAAVRVGNDVWYLSQDGIRSILLSMENNVRATDVPVSQAIQNFVKEKITWTGSLLADSVLGIFDNYVICTIPYGGNLGGGPNAAIAFDLLTKAWVGVWTDVPALAMINCEAYQSEKLVCFRTDCSPFSLIDGGWHDRGGILRTRGYSMGDPTQRKRYLTGIAEVSSEDASFSLEVCGADTTDAMRCLTDEAVSAEGWYIIIPPEGIYVPPEGIWFAGLEITQKHFYMGVVARAALLTFVISGPLSLRSVAVSAVPGKKILEA